MTMRVHEDPVQQLKAVIRGQLDLNNAAADEEFIAHIERAVFAWSRDHPLTAGEKAGSCGGFFIRSAVWTCCSR
jgi:hypothetical protein